MGLGNWLRKTFGGRQPSQEMVPFLDSEAGRVVRIPASEFLMMEGFKVLQARTGPEAIHVVQQNRSRLDVLITDIVMPKMTGHEVAEKLIELNPDLKVMYMSGDTSEAARNSTDSSDLVILRKPFRLETLKDRIHDLLGD